MHVRAQGARVECVINCLSIPIYISAQSAPSRAFACVSLLTHACNTHILCIAMLPQVTRVERVINELFEGHTFRQTCLHASAPALIALSLPVTALSSNFFLFLYNLSRHTPAHQLLTLAFLTSVCCL
jgi:hypothetical protein